MSNADDADDAVDVVLVVADVLVVLDVLDGFVEDASVVFVLTVEEVESKTGSGSFILFNIKVLVLVFSSGSTALILK